MKYGRVGNALAEINPSK